jgi:hypothetical protein
MKDKVFIGWSGSNKVAMQIKKILEQEYNYICCIGGNADNSSSFASVGDTVIQQIKSCNQAIMIFSNKADGSISNNLFFELGYVFSAYGAKKVHCVKRQGENIVLPSDFDNSFVEPINCEDDDVFVKGIVDYFLGRQKMSIEANKMMLINNRFKIRDMLQAHYSAVGSRCSDYELAQYVLFYMQASYMFGDNDVVEQELRDFKRNHYHEMSTELGLAIDICLNYMEMEMHLKMNAEGKVYIEEDAYFEFVEEEKEILSEIVADTAGTFDEWAKVFAHNHLCYANFLFASNTDNDMDLREMLYHKSIDAAKTCLEEIAALEKSAVCRENNDGAGLLSLFKAYEYRNLFLCHKRLGLDGYKEWLELAKKERKALVRNFNKGSIDSKLYDNFRMEYYLILVEFMENVDLDSIDKFEKKMYLSEINKYLTLKKEEDNTGIYVKKIEEAYRKLSVND